MSSNVQFAGSVPANYDKYLGPHLFEPYAIELAARIRDKSLNNILEIACGTGRLTKHLLPKLVVDGKLIATDLNPDMISHARDRLKDSRIEWQVANAQELSFDENSFDAAFCQYGVMFFPDKPAALKEAYRVLRPGGKFLFNCWNSVENNPATSIINDVLKKEFPGTAPLFFEEAPYSLYDRDRIRQMLEAASFRNVLVESVNINSSYDSPDVIVNGFLDGTPLSGFLAELDAGKVSAIRLQIREKLVERFGEQSELVPLSAIVCEGTK